MLELRPVQTAVVACLAPSDALDGIGADGALSFRVAPDELLLLTSPEQAPGVLASASAQLGADAVVVDQTDAFATWRLEGDAALEAFRRLSAVPSGERGAMAQGFVAHVPAKILFGEGLIHLIVPSPLSHHVRQRVRDACADLEFVEVEASPFAAASPVGA